MRQRASPCSAGRQSVTRSSTMACAGGRSMYSSEPRTSPMQYTIAAASPGLRSFPGVATEVGYAPAVGRRYGRRGAPAGASGIGSIENPPCGRKYPIKGFQYFYFCDKCRTHGVNRKTPAWSSNRESRFSSEYLLLTPVNRYGNCLGHVCLPISWTCQRDRSRRPHHRARTPCQTGSFPPVRRSSCTA
jgi:hypothetical protein